MQMTKVYSSFPRSIPAHKSSALKTAETELDNPFSNLLRLVADKRLHLLHLICLFLVFRMRCYSGFSLKSTGHMCDGRPLASPVFSPPGGSRRIFLRFSRSMGSTLCVTFGPRFCFFMNYHLAPEQVPLVIVVAHAIPSLAFFLLRYGFIAVKL